MSLKEALEKRLGAHRVECIPNPRHPEQPIIRLYLELNIPVTVIMTHGLSDYEMPVSEKWKDRAFNELFFCVPSYWELDDLETPAFYWIYDWIYRLEQFVREKNTWFGPGHTIPTGNPIEALSVTMKQEYFIFGDPIFVKEPLLPLELTDKTVHFLSIIPIFGDELDYKIGKGTYKFFKRFVGRKNTEVLDDYRSSILKSRVRLF